MLQSKKEHDGGKQAMTVDRSKGGAHRALNGLFNGVGPELPWKKYVKAMNRLFRFVVDYNCGTIATG